MATPENALRVEPQQIQIEGGRIFIFTRQTVLPSAAMIDSHATNYMIGFNSKPWDIYEWNLSPQKARQEFTKLVFTVLKVGGAFLCLESDGRPVGFNIVIDMSIFVQRLKEVERFKRLPKDFISPKHYFETISKIIGISTSKFSRIGYLADVVVDAAYRRRGYGQALLTASLDYLNNTGKDYALAWSINPTAMQILRQEGFEYMVGIGDHGEGIDFLAQGNVWYPTLDLPAKERVAADKHIVAKHFIKKI